MFKSYSKEVMAKLIDINRRTLELVAEKARTSVVDVITDKGIVDTGRLRNSVDYETTDDKAIIGTPVEYAPFLELGTSKMTARPYLKPGVYAIVDDIKKIYEKMLRGLN